MLVIAAVSCLFMTGCFVYVRLAGMSMPKITMDEVKKDAEMIEKEIVNKFHEGQHMIEEFMKPTNSTLPNSTQQFRGIHTSTKKVSDEAMCSVKDAQIYNRDTKECVQHDPITGKVCLLNKFDQIVSVNCEAKCGASLESGDIEKFESCVSECAEQVEGLTPSCAKCFGEHSWAVCTAKKAEKAQAVCQDATRMAECAELLLQRCLPQLKDCTGFENMSHMPGQNSKKKPWFPKSKSAKQAFEAQSKFEEVYV